MTAKATKAPPTKAKATTGAATKTGKTTTTDEAELRRYTPEEVIELKLLPYTSARVLKEKCYRRQVIHHLDGRRITFTLDDIRRENARNTVEPIAA
ncbi:hypothetical protein [Streptomyces odontomachi]|uniref:hypothetical protein n=1 Tax=Streptomyces odontomachi TaxID=2944940 RepID=UPI00210DDD65|nr:hypothetical protein [Streptomyces sp. ODS25]